MKNEKPLAKIGKKLLQKTGRLVNHTSGALIQSITSSTPSAAGILHFFVKKISKNPISYLIVTSVISSLTTHYLERSQQSNNEKTTRHQLQKDNKFSIENLYHLAEDYLARSYNYLSHAIREKPITVLFISAIISGLTANLMKDSK